MSVPEINARHINTKLRPRLTSIMKSASTKGSKEKRISISYYLLEGEAQKSYVDILVLLEEKFIGTGDKFRAEYRLVEDFAAYAGEKEELETFRLSQRAMFKLAEVLSPKDYHEENKQTYDPKKQYVVERAKTGRPKHVITPDEDAKIRELRAEGMSINAISKKLGISNRQIMLFCRSL